MKGALVILVLVVLCAAFASADSEKLRIGVKHRPETCDQKSQIGDTLKIHYTGKLEDGTEFDSSIPRGDPFSFKLGAGQVIKGWDQGLTGMCVGEKRRLKIPASLGYGDRGAPPKTPRRSHTHFRNRVACH
eukprot:Phypoly_transcript_26881.p1 GENE.Phypoly_transcript_26881~~Phypoly_transcript_26881.p1  ORF type:complete len:131 (+),score=13.62 Phypoly_transcript_26881:25-417(+)